MNPEPALVRLPDGRQFLLPPDFVGDCVIHERGDHLEVTWPYGRGTVLISPQIVDEAIAAINRIRSQDPQPRQEPTP